VVNLKSKLQFDRQADLVDRYILDRNMNLTRHTKKWIVGGPDCETPFAILWVKPYIPDQIIGWKSMFERRFQYELMVHNLDSKDHPSQYRAFRDRTNNSTTAGNKNWGNWTTQSTPYRWLWCVSWTRPWRKCTYGFYQHWDLRKHSKNSSTPTPVCSPFWALKVATAWNVSESSVYQIGMRKFCVIEN